MTAETFLTQRLAAPRTQLLCVVFGLLGLPAAPTRAAGAPESTKQLTVADAQIQSIDRLQAEQERLRAKQDAQPPAYEDKVMSESEAGAAASVDDAQAAADAPQGLRAWSLESRIGWGQSNDSDYPSRQATEMGVRAEYRQETLNWGDIRLQIDTRHLEGDRFTDFGGIGTLGYARETTSDRITLRNVGMPLTPGLFADNTLGDMYSEVTDGLSRNYRLSLGSSTVRGLSTRVFGDGLDVRAGTGQRGYWAGGPYPGFEKSQGNLSWLGATRRLSDEWTVSGQFDHAQDVPAYYYSLYSPLGLGSKDVSSWAGSVAYAPRALAEQDVRVRTTVVGSQVGSDTFGVPTGGAEGVFVEASARLGRYAHQVGAYTADPDLHFGDMSLANGTRGAYWRVDHNGYRLSWGGGLDYERGESDALFSPYAYARTGASGNFQFTLDRVSSVGGTFNVYQTQFDDAPSGYQPADNRGVYANLYYQTQFFDLPRTRLSVTALRNEQIVLFGDKATGQEVQWEQDWISGRYEAQRPELTTTLGWANDQSGGTTRQYPTAGVIARYWFDSDFYVAANLRWTSQDSDLYTSRGLSGAISAEKQLAPGWHAGVSANLNQARSTAFQAPLNSPNVYRSDDKTVYVYLRYDGSTGVPFQTVGVRNGGAGTGSLSGRIFQDANRDGRQQPGENGVANVEVVLDGRYRAVTDRDGRYEFPMVTTGSHQITLTPESVPLPWGTNADAASSAFVPLRGRAYADIPVIKVGE